MSLGAGVTLLLLFVAFVLLVLVSLVALVSFVESVSFIESKSLVMPSVCESTTESVILFVSEASLFLSADFVTPLLESNPANFMESKLDSITTLGAMSAPRISSGDLSKTKMGKSYTNTKKSNVTYSSFL